MQVSGVPSTEFGAISSNHFAFRILNFSRKLEFFMASDGLRLGAELQHAVTLALLRKMNQIEQSPEFPPARP